MRSKSLKTNGYVIYAVSGTNTISFAIDFRDADNKGLLGFAVERIDKSKGERKYADGFKVFKEIIPNPDEDTVVNTYSHPIQSFVWDDFTCYPGREYEYMFYTLKGKPKNPVRSKKPVIVKITTEEQFSKEEHDIFFNRGAASSQAYRRKFFNLAPEDIKDEDMKHKALAWLSRELDEAIYKFIEKAGKGDTLLGCFYEFHYEPVVSAFKAAMLKGVKVKIIIDAKVNESTDKEGNFHESFPREANLRALKNTKIPADKKSGIIFPREAKTNDIQHNKFIVLVKGNKPTEVWTGSTNISLGGIHGQTNVGHWIKNEDIAEKYRQYWEILKSDPGAVKKDNASDKRKKNNELKREIEKLQPNIKFTSWKDIPSGITSVFSPRSGPDMLESYAKMFDEAEDLVCITLAFGINKIFKQAVKDNTDKDQVSLILLEKEDKPNKRSKEKFYSVGANQNVYQAWGAYLYDNLYQWTKEVSPRNLKLNRHVAYIHTKFMLIDPLGLDPVVVTGSANFSEASTNDNDENMLIIRGNKRCADIYYTEFNRLFNHFYFRAVYNKVKNNRKSKTESMFLAPDDSWLSKYKPGKFRYKKIEKLANMKGFS